MRAARWIMRAIAALVICVIAGITIASAVLGYRAGKEIKGDKKTDAISSYVEKHADFDQTFADIDIQAARDMDVSLQTSADGACHVHYYDSDEVVHSVMVEDDRLVISCRDDRLFGSDIGFGKNPYMIVEIPAWQYDTVKIVSDSGQISASQALRCKNLEVTEDSGRLYLVNVTADVVKIANMSGETSIATMKVRNLTYDGKRGDLSVINVMADNVRFNIGDGRFDGYNLLANSTSMYKSDKGDITLERSDSPTSVFVSKRGDIHVTLLSLKRVNAESDGGDIDIPETQVEEKYNGNCQASTGAGDITIQYVEE